MSETNAYDIDRERQLQAVSQGVHVFIFAFLIFTCLMGTTIAIYALWRIFWKNSEELRSVDKTTIYSAASCIILHALTCICDPVGYYFFAFTPYQGIANIVWLIWDILWTAAKLNLYFVYIYRCHVTFKGTKYAHSPLKVYVPLACAWILQLFNGIVFVLHKLDDADTIDEGDNPLSSDKAVLIASCMYLILDIVIVLSVVFLFLHPIIRLMVDLRTKSERLMHINNAQSEIELVKKSGNESSSSELLTPTTPHSPTKMGAAYYYKSNKKHKKGGIAIPTNTSVPTQNTNVASNTDIESSSNVFKMKNFQRLPCPEDEVQNDEITQLQPTKSPEFKGIVWNKKQIKILNTGTRLALLSVISLSSGFVYQVLWIVSVGINSVGNFTYTWGIDTVINIICIYLSFHFAVTEYNILCTKCCHCHGCCLRCVQNMAKKQVS